jgi:hypothetical protein
MEWLLVALDDETLAREPWIHRGMEFLVTHLAAIPPDANYGGYSHCAHALRLYEKRMDRLVPHN